MAMATASFIDPVITLLCPQAAVQPGHRLHGPPSLTPQEAFFKSTSDEGFGLEAHSARSSSFREMSAPPSFRVS
jgi:hypothetical protein